VLRLCLKIWQQKSKIVVELIDRADISEDVVEKSKVDEEIVENTNR